jgi:choline kinase
VIGLVLAAGASRRLRPETDHLPKALLPVAGELTILDVILRNLAAVGIAEVAIVVGYAADAVAARVAEMQRAHGVSIELIPNDRALEWNNAYSLWLAAGHFSGGALLVNGDTLHPVSVEKTLMAAEQSGEDADLIIALDDAKKLAEEEMKVQLGERRQLVRISKAIDPASADGEYIGVSLIRTAAAARLADALEATWRRDPGLYYEDGFQELADRGGTVAAAPIGVVDWVEVDNHADLRRARQIAGHC